MDIQRRNYSAGLALLAEVLHNPAPEAGIASSLQVTLRTFWNKQVYAELRGFPGAMQRTGFEKEAQRVPGPGKPLLPSVFGP